MTEEEILAYVKTSPEKRVTETMMQKLLKEWQHRLGLDNWHIVLEEDVSPNDMELPMVQGETEYDIVNSCAVIRILDEKDYGKRILPFDKEKVLVHELLHIKMWFIYESDSELQSKMVHQLIDDMARSLVDAKRFDNKSKKC